MISKNHILKIAKHVLRRDQGHVDRRLLHPVREWFIGVACASMLFCFSVYYVGTEFYTQLEQTVTVPATEVTVVTYRAQVAQGVFETYKSRSQRFAELQSNTPKRAVVEPTEEQGSTATSDQVSESPIEGEENEEFDAEAPSLEAPALGE